MHTRITPTLALVIAGGLAAGIGLARGPGPADAPNPAPPVADPEPRGGYLSGGNEVVDGPAGPTTSWPASSGSASLVIEDFAFAGAPQVSPGQAIDVVNNDGVAHTLTDRDRRFDTGDLAGGASATISAPAETGTYAFFCTIHPSMQGSFTVQ